MAGDSLTKQKECTSKDKEHKDEENKSDQENMDKNDNDELEKEGRNEAADTSSDEKDYVVMRTLDYEVNILN